MKNVFRKIEDVEIKASYNIIVGRTNWLNKQGIRQWSQPIPENVILERQKAGRFFGYWSNDELVAVVCLLDKSVSNWKDLLQGKYLYMATLASDIRYKGRKFGQDCAVAACQYAKENNKKKIYLDCIDNQSALPNFYTKLGYKIIEKKKSEDSRVDILMVKYLLD